MIAANCAAIIRGDEQPTAWVVAFAPLFAMILLGMGLKVMVVRARQASNRDPDQNPCAVGVVMGVMMMLVATTLVTLVLWLDGAVDWPLSAVISPAMLVALCIAFLGTTIGCFVASAKVELPAEADQITTDAVIRTF
jgi:high-affinity K+ transport system ATPase subunit B